jgi:hypothetical protein
VFVLMKLLFARSRDGRPRRHDWRSVAVRYREQQPTFIPPMLLT